MPLNIEIPDDEVRYCITSAKIELVKVLNEHKEDVLKEAGRLEQRNRAAARKTPEITGDNIRDAAIFIRKGITPPEKSKWISALEVLSWVLTGAAGYLISQVSQPWGLTWFVIAIVPTMFVVSILALRK